MNTINQIRGSLIDYFQQQTKFTIKVTQCSCGQICDAPPYLEPAAAGDIVYTHTFLYHENLQRSIFAGSFIL